MTKKWLASQLNMVYRKSNQFKERGSAYGLYHPFIIYYLDHLSLLRQAEMKDEETMLFGEGYISIIELGENLFVLQEDYDLNKMRRRLQADDNFDDTCWELEVMQALKYSGVNAQIIEEGNGKSFDLLAEVSNNKACY